MTRVQIQERERQKTGWFGERAGHWLREQPKTPMAALKKIKEEHCSHREGGNKNDSIGGRHLVVNIEGMGNGAGV